MRGWDYVLQTVAGELQDRTPAKLLALRKRLGPEAGPLTKDELPDPLLYTTEERAALPINDWPAIVVTAQAKGNVRAVDISATGGPVYQADYLVRVYVWARGKSYAHANRIRNRLSLGLTELLNEAPTLGQDAFRVNPLSMTERPAETVRDKSQRSIAATYLEFAVTIEETVEVEGIGLIETSEIETLPPHPALD